MKIHPGFVGIDISKRFLDVYDSNRDAVRQIPNEPAEIARLVETWIGMDVFVLFEATGQHDRALRTALGGRAIAFARVNPSRARDFARAAGFLAKTDAIDARMLAAMAQCLRPASDTAADPAREDLAMLNKRRDQLVASRKQERTRLYEARGAAAESIAAHIAWLDAAIHDIEGLIETTIAQHADLDSARRLMCSVPGIGIVSATTLLALMPELGSRSPKTIAALAGLAPFNIDSGKFRGQRTIRGGRRRVRSALYMAATSVSRSKSRFADTYRSLRVAGKPAKVALIAVARKLLVTLNAIIRDQQPFCP